jgi:hypothetical protein
MVKKGSEGRDKARKVTDRLSKGQTSKEDNMASQPRRP